MANSMNVLFICSRNKWRSPTGERVFRGYDGLTTRSAGTGEKAKRKVKNSDILWADLIFVMEEKHFSRMRSNFRYEMNNKAVYVLDIPDDYGFMDPELVELITTSVTPVVDAYLEDS